MSSKSISKSSKLCNGITFSVTVGVIGEVLEGVLIQCEHSQPAEINSTNYPRNDSKSSFQSWFARPMLTREPGVNGFAPSMINGAY